MSKKYLFTVVTVISALTLALEFLQTRIFSVVSLYHIVYIVITMALVGIAASGTVLSVSSRLRRLTDAHFFLLCLMGFSFSSSLATKLASYPLRDMPPLPGDPRLVLVLIFAYSLCMVPYFFAGLAIGGAFMRFPQRVNSLYCANLIGSGAGSLLFVLCMRPLGAPKFLLCISIAAAVCALPLVKKNILMQTAVVLWVAFLAVGAALPQDARFLRIACESHKPFWTTYEHTAVEYTGWDAVSRIDVISNAIFPADKRILIDGDAQAAFFNLDLVRTVSQTPLFIDRHAAYTLLPGRPGRALVLGAGGGFEVLVARLHGVRAIDAVEINPLTAYLISEKYSAHLGNVLREPSVKLYVEDGRSFVRRAPYRYDCIMMCATDSFLALSTGAYVLMDSYLYTQEAFVDYLDHLSDDGVLQIGRWHYKNKPRETLRVFATALHALRKSGYTNPAAHLIVIAPNDAWADVLIKKHPLGHEETERLGLFCKTHGITVLFSEQLFKETKGKKDASAFVELADHFLKGTEQAFYRAYEYNVAPVSDDRPFFYHYTKWNSAVQKDTGSSPLEYHRIRGRWYLFVLFSLLLHSIALSLVLLLLPLMAAKNDVRMMRNKGFLVGYFFSIGFAFMLIEMGLVQKCVLFLGHPIYSMALVIPVVLICAGCGSLVARRIRDASLSSGIVLTTCLCAALALVLRGLLPSLSSVTLLQPVFVRAAVVAATIAPLAFCMGFPFPLALRALAGESAIAIPWAWASSGASSVIASIAAIIIAMYSGFTAVLSAGALFYLLATMAALRHRMTTA